MRNAGSKAARERRNTQDMSPNGVSKRLQEPPFFTVQIRRNSPLPIYRQSQQPSKALFFLKENSGREATWLFVRKANRPPAKPAYTNKSRRDCGPSDFLHSTVTFLYLLVNTGL